MSRVGKLPIEIPSGVTITVDPDTITVRAEGNADAVHMPGINRQTRNGPSFGHP
jgi:ribosomal protein L6P/L9E